MNEIKFTSVPQPFWIASTQETAYPTLEEDLELDIAIVGGGMVGILSGYLLSQAGLKVAVLEADRILQGTTGHTTAKITSQHSLIYDRLKKSFGEELARQYADANEAAIHLIDDLAGEHQIECDFVWRPAFVYTQSDKYVEKLEKEAEAASSLGIMASVVDHLTLPFTVKAALRFEHQAQFHPLKFLKALAEEMVKKGGQIFEKTHAVEIEEGRTCTVNTSQGKRVKADQVIIATHYPFFDGGGLYFSRIYQERSYIIGVSTKEKLPAGMYISAENPTRSLRSQRFQDGEMILVGGEHHKTGQCQNTNLCYQNLIEFARENFTVKDVLYRWSTQDCSTLDGLPYVGRLTLRSPNSYLATGFGKWGMTNSAASAMILRDLITRGESPWAGVYNPSRSTSASAIVNFIVQNADVAKNYVAGKLEPAMDSLDIEKGQAQVVYVDGQKMGAFRDDNGQIHIVDLTCPHVGCELEWNHAERTWDCPCHGSRFSYEGDIIEGPAQYCLSHIEQQPNPVDPHVYQ